MGPRIEESHEPDRSFVDILRGQAGRRAGKTAFTFLADGAAEPGDRLTYADLDLRARALGARLRTMGLAGERALLLYPPGLEFIAAFFGCLYGGVTAVPANLPRRDRPMPRLRAIVDDARPGVLLTTSSLLPDADLWAGRVPGLAAVERLATDRVDPAWADRWEHPAAGRETLAFLQYTSGSTAEPKGVRITHGNLLANSALIRECFDATAESRGVSWLPLFHDMGLIGGVLQPIYCGGSTTLMPPVSFIQRPVRWLEAISRTGARISGGPDFAYDLCVRKIGPEARKGLDLSRWDVAFNGAEPIRPETLERFAAAFAPCGFRREAFLPCYGLAESTLLVSGRRSESGPVVFTARASTLGRNRVEAAAGSGDDERAVVSSGGVAGSQEVVIVDPETGERLSEDGVGEIWVRGESVADGYWDRPEATRETFRAVLPGEEDRDFLRTGDLGFLRGGELFVNGRLKDLIIIRGRNVFPQDVEWSVAGCHPSLSPGGGAAFSVDIGGEERLVVIHEVERVGKTGRAQEVIAAIRTAVAESADLDLHAVRLLKSMSLPKTSSGKVRRRACRDAFLEDRLEVVGAWTRDDEGVVPGNDEAEHFGLRNGHAVPPTGLSQGGGTATVPRRATRLDRGDLATGSLGRTPEEQLHQLTASFRDRAAGVLRLAPRSLDPDRPLNTMGLDSLTSMELKAGIEDELGITLPLSLFLEGPTVARIAEEAMASLAGPAKASGPPLEATSDGAEDSGLSVGQRDLWYAHQLSSDAGAYNIAGAARIGAEVDPACFRRALQRLVDRHEGLRSVFPSIDGHPVRDVREVAVAQFRPVDASAWGRDELERACQEEARRAFDLERGPLHRIVLWSRSTREHVVLFAIHHIIGDFWTVAVILEEFGRIYAAERAGTSVGLPPIRLRYADFVRWQAESLAGPTGESLARHWKSRLSPPSPDLDLPADHPRPAVRSGRGSVRHLELDAELTGRLRDLAGSRRASLYTTLLAAFQTLLSRYSGRDDLVVGSPVAGRIRPGLEGIVGYFVNLVPMRADLSGDPSFSTFLGRVQKAVHEGLEHQDYPYGLMVEDQGLGTDPSRTPIFQVMFTYQQAQRLGDEGLTPFALSSPGHRLELGGLPLESMALDRRAALFDLTLMAAHAGGKLSFSMEYSSDLFEPATVDRMLGHFRTLLGQVVSDPEARIGEISLMDASERRRVLHEWGRARGDTPRTADRGLVGRIEAHAERSPDAVAVAMEEERLSYRELNREANRVAHVLRGLGVGPGRLVGLCCERSPRLLVGILGILKAGGAYVPLDPAHPMERLSASLRDAGVTVLVVDRRTRDGLVGAVESILDLDDCQALELSPENNSGGPWSLDDPAYVIFTSGSTGTPKGVMVAHRGLASAYLAWESAYDLRAGGDRHLQMAGVAFDVFTGDWARALGSGATLVLCPRESLLDAETLASLIERERITIAEFVPAVAEGMVGHLERSGRSLDSLRLVAVGSDLWHAGQHERLRRVVGPRTRVINSYGLTEATIDSTYFEGDLSEAPADRPVPIGRPFAGTRVYVLDRRMQTVPAGVPGELYIGGAGVALGYVNRPALTAERFLPDPFADDAGARMYRTGDLARWGEDGTLELLGRADHQVKIRGFRIEPGEIESALLRHPSVREAAVVVREETAGDRRLAAYVVAWDGPSPDVADLRRWARERLPEPMVPSSFVVLGALPLTANGKVDRRALSALVPPPSERSAEWVGPRNDVERELAKVVGEVLGVDPVGVHEDLFVLGADSIRIVQMVSRARRLGLRLDPMQMFRHPTIAELAAAIGGTVSGEPEAVEDDLLADFDRDVVAKALEDGSEIEDIYPLSPVQEGMLYHTMAEPEAGAYIEQFRCRLEGPLDPSAFVWAWQALVDRHSALRTAIQWVDSDRPLQVVHRRAELPVVLLDWREVPEAEHEARITDSLREDRLRGFVPSFAPMLRLAVVRLGESRHEMVWTSHHLVIDGWCMTILLGEVLALYEAELEGREAALPAARSFRGYLAWLRRQDLSLAEAFWRRELAGFDAATPLGIDRIGNYVPAGLPPFAEREARVDEGATAALGLLARAGGLTLGTILQGAWSLLLSRYSGRAEVVHGVTVSGRPPDLEGVETIVGVLINTLPFRVAVDEGSALVPWLKGLQARLVEIRRYEFSPLVRVREWSDVPRGRPLFESIVVVQNTPIDATLAARASGLGVRDARIYEQTSFPLTLTVVPGEKLQLRLGYDSRRFDAGSIDALLAHFRNLLRGMAEAPDRTLESISMLSAEESERLVRATTDVPHDPPPGQGMGLPALDLDRLSDVELDSYILDIQRSLGGASS